jgi:phosphoribosyl 1,2-cyclic phosphodiesterase
MRYTLLASGSKGNACLIETPKTRILIDCGTTKKYLLSCFTDLEMKFNDLDALVLTHNHGDHISQLKHFYDVPIHSPFDVVEALNFNLVKPNHGFQINDLTLYPIELSHDTDIVIGYIIFDGYEKLVYITDTGYIREEDLIHCVDANYIIMESNYDPVLLLNSSRPYLTKMRIMSDRGHLSNDKAGFYLSQIVTPNTSEIVLAHLSEEANNPEVAMTSVRKYLDEIGYNKSLKVAYQHKLIRGGTQ